MRSPRSPARRRKFIRASVRGEVRACTSEVSSVGNVSRRTTMRGRKHTITALGSVRARQLHRMLAVFLRRSTIAPISKGASTLIIGVATSPTNRAAKNWQGFTIGFAIGRQAIGIFVINADKPEPRFEFCPRNVRGAPHSSRDNCFRFAA